MVTKEKEAETVNVSEERKKALKLAIDKIEKDASCIAGRIIIESNTKERIIRELALFGITKETLFCDSIDVVCESIKDKFEQKIHGKNDV